MKTIEGDLLKLATAGEFDVIVHGCNCFCTMGKGIALSVKQQFPSAYQADCATEKGDKNKLGGYTQAVIEQNNHTFTVVNAYTQYNWRSKKNADYDAIKAVFEKIKTNFSGQRIGYPLIGAGLAGGDWAVISDIISTALSGEDHTLVRFKP